MSTVWGGILKILSAAKRFPRSLGRIERKRDMHVTLFLRCNSLESCAPAAGRGARSDLAARAVPGCVGSLQAPFDFADGRDHVCCFRVTLYVCQPSGAAGCLRLGGSAVWLRAVFALSFGREPCSRRGFRSGACADRILVSEDCPHRLPAAGGGSKSCFPNGGRERHALPLGKFFASKGPQRAGTPFVDFPYVLVGVPPIFGAPAGCSALPVSPLLCRAAPRGMAARVSGRRTALRSADYIL